MRPFDQKQITCPKNHSHRAVLLPHAPDAQLAVAVVPPAPQAAARHRAGVVVARGDGGGGGARRACTEGGGGGSQLPKAVRA